MLYEVITAHLAFHLQAGLVGRNGDQHLVVVLLDDLDHVGIGVAANAVANRRHLAQQVLVVLAGDDRVELFGIAFTVVTVAGLAFLLVEHLAVGDLLGGIGPFIVAVVERDAQGLDAS